jgi:cytochrome c oxidase subunit 1
MVTYDSGANLPESSQDGWVGRHLFGADHKTIGLNYLWLALFSVFLGMGLSLLMRIHLVWPSVRLPFVSGLANTPERYAALTLLHGSLMIFMVLTAAPQAGFGNYFLPLQIGARDMAFPTLNLLSFWAAAASLLGMTISFFVPAGSGLTLWVASVALFCFASLLSALNFSTTTLDLRTTGMTLPRMPLTVWAWFLTAILGSLIFSILLAACVFLLSDRVAGTHFFTVPQLLAGSMPAASPQEIPALWQRLFWFFAQAEVYVAVLPCLGITSHLLSTFARKPAWALRASVLALGGVGLFGFCIWGYHMFAIGMNPYAPLVFATVAESLGLPAVILLASWLGTLWNGKIQLTTAMLFALGFISLFVSGGLSGLFLARADLAGAGVNDEVITGHFHLVMGVSATFAILGALFFWFPKMFGRRLSEPLGKLHFWLTFAGVYCIFMPMHWLGLIAHSGAPAGNPVAAAAGGAVRDFITGATVVTIAAQGIFLFNFIRSVWWSTKVNEKNPWHATTLEWSIASPTPFDNFGAGKPVVYRGAYEFGVMDGAEDFVPQHLAPEQVASGER